MSYFTQVVNSVLSLHGASVYALVGGLVFAEDALFVGFVLPGETAALLGGVAASRHQVSLYGMMAVVVAAAIIGDTVGYEIGNRIGPPLLRVRLLDRRRTQLEKAQDLLARRGGSAVFLGRFIAFFRAVMPALAGIARMRYLKFLTFNAAGGLVWGIGVVLLGYLAGNSYVAVEKHAGEYAAIGVAGVVVLLVIAWRVRRHLVERREARSGGARRAGGGSRQGGRTGEKADQHR